jgi:secreted PhoX family phosphatase
MTNVFINFISAKPDSLLEGELFVANLVKGEWVSLDYKKSKILKKTFKSEWECLARTREAAEIMGGSPLDRPEDIEVHPITKEVFIATTNNIKKNRPQGAILKISEENSDPLSLKFSSSVFLSGGESTGFSCPDNLLFDEEGNLWLTTDIDGRLIQNKDYKYHGNNSLFFIPVRGRYAGQAIRVASAPVDAEFTGPCLSPDRKSLFLCVQHPGEHSISHDQFSSHWPEGGKAMPKSAVVQIQGIDQFKAKLLAV